MSEPLRWPGSRQEPDPGTGVPVSDSAHDAMINAAHEVMTVQDITRGDKANPIRVRGTLTIAAENALRTLRPRFEAVGYTPVLRREDDQDVIRALPTVFEQNQDTRRVTRIAWILFALTVLSVFITGMDQTDDKYISVIDAIVPLLTGDWGRIPPILRPTPEAWNNALLSGLMFTASMLSILGAHEMGHFLMARHHNVQTTPPFFIPLPIISILGTMGAVIAMREPAPNRRVQFDIGIAGPLAGLIVATPLMILGLSLSTLQTLPEHIARTPPEVYQAFTDLTGRDEITVYQEGDSLAYLALKGLVYGQFLPASGEIGVWWHPIAFAAWAGFLVTMLNLIPVGQLDGGHIVYGLFGNKASKLRIPVLIILTTMALMGTIRDIASVPEATQVIPAPIQSVLMALPGWSTWWLWVLIIYFMLRSHAPVLDEITELDPKRKALGFAMLVVFALIFAPAPLIPKTVQISVGLIQQIAMILF